MPDAFAQLLFTPDVQHIQDDMGSRRAGDAKLLRGALNDTLSPFERAFIAARDGFYISTISSNGWPYIQFRGGPPGFLHVLDDHTLAFADIVGNRQYISTGNLRGNTHAALFLMDYPHQARLKILADAEFTPWAHAPAWKDTLLRDEGYNPERVVTLHIKAFDWNCPQHIPQRYTAQEIADNAFADRILALEAENKSLRQALTKQQTRP